MSSNLFDGGKLVQSRHCRELAKILVQDCERLNEFRQALRIPVADLSSMNNIQVKGNNGSAEVAFYEVIQCWINKCPKNATFGALIDVVGRQLEFIQSADAIMEHSWS